MFRSLIFVAAFSLSAAAHAALPAPLIQKTDDLTVSLQLVEESTEPLTVFDTDNCVKTSGLIDEAIVNWDQIVAIGTKIWQVVEANKPVVNVKTPVVSALPQGLTCWAELDSWKAPKVQLYEVVYKNGFGMEVTKMRFRLHYTYGGGKNGKGQYLANVTVMPAELNVVWGYTFNSSVEVGQAVNLGTSDSPIAGIELNLKWQVKTVLKEINSSYHYFVQGDGISQASQ